MMLFMTLSGHVSADMGAHEGYYEFMWAGRYGFGIRSSISPGN